MGFYGFSLCLGMNGKKWDGIDDGLLWATNEMGAGDGGGPALIWGLCCENKKPGSHAGIFVGAVVDQGLAGELRHGNGTIAHAMAV